MRKKLLCGMGMGVFLLCLAGVASATLTTIGTATHYGSDHKLIWDDDNNGKSVVWLDAVHAHLGWEDQNAWAAGLSTMLTINLYPGYAITWDEPNWRLPSTVDGPYVFGYDGTSTGGYNITTSEMGHLLYVELGDPASYGTDGSFQFEYSPIYGIPYTGDFHSVDLPWFYWSSTEYAADPDLAWGFYTCGGKQSIYDKDAGSDYYDPSGLGLALRGGQVSIVAPTPIPAPVLLLGTGLLGLVPMIRRKKGSRCR